MNKVQVKFKQVTFLLVLQVSAISAMRNVVSRAKHLSETFVRLGIEELLIETARRHPQATEDAVKAAQRDLGLKVHLKEEWTGTKTTPLAS